MKNPNIYHSFEEYGRAKYGLQPVGKRRTKDKDKLESQRKKFLGDCRVCHKPLTYMGGNVLCCTNPECKGDKHTRKGVDGNEIVTYSQVFRILDDNGADIASNLFD